MSSLYGDCISHILKFLPLDELTPVILVNRTWNGGLTQSVWHTHCLLLLEKEIVNAKLNSNCVKLYRKLFGDNHQIIEDLLLNRQEKVIKKKIPVKKTQKTNRRKEINDTRVEKKIEKVEKKVSNAKKKEIDYHKSLKGYVMGKLIRREGDELKKLIRFPLQKVFGEGDGRKIDRKVAFERKWKKVKEFLNEKVSFHKDDLKNKYTSNSINEMFLKRLKYDLNLVLKKDSTGGFEVGRMISLEMASGQLLQRFKVMRFVELFYEYFDSSLIMSDQLQLITDTSEVPIEKFDSFTFESFKMLLDFISKYCPKQAQSIRNHIENDTTKDTSLKSFLFEKPQRFLGHYLLGKFGMKLFADISSGFEYCLEEYKFEIPNFLVECLIYRTDKIDETKKMDMVEAYAKQHNISYLNLDFIIEIINRSTKERYYKRNETVKYIETLLPKIKDDPKLPLIFRITACGKLVDSWGSDEFLTLMEVILNYSKKVFDRNVQPPYSDPLIFVSGQLYSAYGTFSAVQGWVDLFVKFLDKGSKKKFVDKTGRSFAEIVKSKAFPSRKSAITIFFVQQVFVTEYDPTIEDSYRKLFTVDEEPTLLEVLDTAGPEEFSALRDQYMRVGHAFVIVCSTSDESSVSDMRRHVEQMVHCKDTEINDMPVVFVMNKMDLLVSANREETIDRFKQQVNSIVSDNSLLNYSMVECSAKKGENIDKIFVEIVRKQRMGGVDNLTLLKGCIEQDTSYIDECKKKVQVKKKKCSIM